MKKEVRQLDRIATGIEKLSPGAMRNTAQFVDEKMPLRGRLILAIGASSARAERARQIRRSFPITAKVGPNGGGKSVCAVYDKLPSLDAGRTVLSTVKLLDHRTGEPHAFYEPFYDIDQLVNARSLDVLMDEVTGIANSRNYTDIPQVVINRFVQLRRVDVTVDWTAPNYARADKVVREVTQAVTECRGYLAGSGRTVTGEIRQWAPKRLFRFRTYDTMDFEEWTTGKRDRAEPIVGEWFNGVGSRVFASYDTMDAVTAVAMPNGRVCMTCDGSVRQKACRCTVPLLHLPSSSDANWIGTVTADLESAAVRGPLEQTSTDPDAELAGVNLQTGELDDAFELVDRAAFDGHQAIVMVGENTAVV